MALRALRAMKFQSSPVQWDMNPRPRKLYSNISGRQIGIQTRDTIPLITSYPYSRIAECHVWGCNWMGFTLCAIAVKVQVKYTFTLQVDLVDLDAPRLGGHRRGR